MYISAPVCLHICLFVWLNVAFKIDLQWYPLWLIKLKIHRDRFDSINLLWHDFIWCCVSYGFYCKQICINSSYIVHGLRWIRNRIPLDMMPVLCSFYSISFFSCSKWRIGCECERTRKRFSTRSCNSMEK